MMLSIYGESRPPQPSESSVDRAWRIPECRVLLYIHTERSCAQLHTEALCCSYTKIIREYILESSTEYKRCAKREPTPVAQQRGRPMIRLWTGVPDK